MSVLSTVLCFLCGMGTIATIHMVSIICWLHLQLIKTTVLNHVLKGYTLT